MEPQTNSQLHAMTQRRYTGDCTQLVHSLARQLIAANELNKTALEQVIRDRSRVIDLERRFKPIGRVLMVDLPPFVDGQDYGCVDIYSDPGVEICMVKPRANFHDPKFDEALEDELKRTQERFRMMPWELGPSYRSTWMRWATTNP